MRVGIDLDGVVYDYVGAMREFVWDANMRPATELPDPDRWEIWECWDISKGDWDNMVERSTEWGVFYAGAAYPGAVDALHELRSLGHTLHIATYRMHPEAQLDTVRWLRDNHIPCDTLHFSESKLDVEVDAFIEDSPQNALALQAAGRATFLMSRPWNQRTDAHLSVPVVITWQDFVAEVQHLEAQRLAGIPERAAVRRFESGAVRDLDDDKFDYEGFLSPLVLQRFAAYMHTNRKLKDGSLRASDNWQAGMDPEVYMKSLWRHFMDVWMLHRGHDLDGITIDEALCGVLFNAMGLAHETLKESGPS